jgi:hypothetical protein
MSLKSVMLTFVLMLVRLTYNVTQNSRRYYLSCQLLQLSLPVPFVNHCCNERTRFGFAPHKPK